MIDFFLNQESTKICNDALKSIMNSRNMKKKKKRFQYIQGHEIYVQNKIKPTPYEQYF